MIVIIAIAVLVLVVIAAFFVGGTRPLTGTGVEQAFAGLCSMQVTRCGVEPSSISVTGVYDLDQNGVLDETTTLANVCTKKGISTTTVIDTNPCRQACGCTK